jgi:hypothetical protein
VGRRRAERTVLDVADRGPDDALRTSGGRDWAYDYLLPGASVTPSIQKLDRIRV